MEYFISVVRDNYINFDGRAIMTMEVQKSIRIQMIVKKILFLMKKNKIIIFKCMKPCFAGFFV